MMGIDYKKYLSGLGEVATDHKTVIKKYLEEQAETDGGGDAAESPDVPEEDAEADEDNGVTV